jgi:16S rRNA (guanine527-N7)-methyltransferase
VGDGSRQLRAVLRRSRAAGFLGPGAVDDHIRHAESFLDAVDVEPKAFLDLGSGGGVPGLVLATRWRAASGVLLDAQARRVAFLASALRDLGCADRVRAVHGRAEELAWDPALRGRFDLVTARSFGPPGVTAECAAGFLRSGGVLLVAEPPGGPDRWPKDGLDRLGLRDEGEAETGAARLRRLRSGSGPPATVPRRPAAIRRSPPF